jgi:hypothetical protein
MCFNMRCLSTSAYIIRDEQIKVFNIQEGWKLPMLSRPNCLMDPPLAHEQKAHSYYYYQMSNITLAYCYMTVVQFDDVAFKINYWISIKKNKNKTVS